MSVTGALLSEASLIGVGLYFWDLFLALVDQRWTLFDLLCERTHLCFPAMCDQGHQRAVPTIDVPSAASYPA